MRVTISWRNYPNCPEATEYDKSRSYLMHFIGMFVGIALFALVIGFFVCMSSFWTDADWGQFFGGLLCLLSGGALAHMVFVWYPHCTEKGLQLIFLKYKTSSFDNFKKLEEKRIKKECNDELRETTKIYYFWFLSVVIFALIVCIFIFSIVRIIFFVPADFLECFNLFSSVKTSGITNLYVKPVYKRQKLASVYLSL